MRTLRFHSIIILLSFTPLLGLWGCAHVPKPPSEEMRGQFGAVGIVSEGSSPNIQFHPEFAKGRLAGAAMGAGIGTGAGALYGLSIIIGRGGSCGGQACAGVVVIAAAASAIGAVAGGVLGG